MKAIVNFTDGTSSKVIVRQSYSKAGIHYYSLTLNKLKSWLDFEPGETKLFTGEQISKLTYVMN